MELLERENDLKYNAAVMRERREIVPHCLEELSKEDNDEKEALINTGFVDWNRNEYQNFLRGCEKFGRHDYQRISNVRFSLTVADRD